MRYIQERVRNLSIRHKILYGSYLIIMPILLLFFLMITALRYSTVRENYIRQQMDSVANLASSLEILFRDVHDLSLTLSINTEILDILCTPKPDQLNQDSELWAHRTAIRMVEDIVALKGYIKTISIYPENGVNPYLRCMDASAYISDFDKLRTFWEYKETTKRKGKGLWVRCSRGKGRLFEANREDKLALCRGIWDVEAKEQFGFLTIGISETEIRELCENTLLEPDEGILLFNALGEIIGSYGKETDGAGQYIEENGLLEKQMGFAGYPGGELYIYETLPGSCYVCKTARQKDFFGFLGEIVYMPLLAAIGIVIGLFPVLLFVSSLISEPMGKICAAMVQFRQGDFEQRLKVASEDEIGQVAEGFNQMVAHIKELIDKNYVMALKERESELAILQAQINPHFLYNALDSIYWQAVSAEDEDTAESIYRLSQLFRLVLSQGSQIVTVEMEAELIQRYLEIQKMRFLHQMEYSIDIESVILEEKIPKFILQPFVENAIVHGMEKKKEGCTVTVAGKWQDDGMVFIIADTGVGMAQDQLDKIWEEDVEKMFHGQRIGSYAIKNIRERLQLAYGGAYRLDIASEEGQGTTVTIYLPVDMKEGLYGDKTINSRG